MNSANDESNVVVDALIGAAAGAAAVWVMGRVDWFNFKHEDPEARRRTQAVRPGGMDPAHVLADKAASALGKDLEPKEMSAAALSIHYSLGVLPGAIYGALRAQTPELTAGRGTLFGLGLFLLQDEGLNAVTGLSAKPQDYPWQAHARGFVAHAVYGLVLDSALRLTDGLRGKD
ncbi:DUF1440 domain-containing protein [Altericroceibacterium xinjiangense]|uniref:DUF1440 domain-containing protein n=1 Tax=Altericroceibacterium xinjiangense TaxID=762261 RepID=UPI0019D20CEB|nr:DUF1440 domain-containing protein [Altericroceibacterium xinjiangense]